MKTKLLQDEMGVGVNKFCSEFSQNKWSVKFVMTLIKKLTKLVR